MLFRRKDPEECERLFQDGLRFLEDFDTYSAIKIAKELCQRGYSGAYEIWAKAYLQDDQEQDAVAILEKGVKKFSNVSKLWSMLGECRSNLGDYDKALEAFGRSAEGTASNPSLARYNIAVVLWRQGNFIDALRAIEQVGGDEPPEATVSEMRATILIDLNRPEEARLLLSQLMEGDLEELPPKDRSRIAALWADLYARDGEMERAKHSALESISLDKTNPRASRVLRRASGVYSAKAWLYRVLVNGRWHEPLDGKEAFFFATYWVVAEDPEQLQPFIAPFERLAANTLRIESAEPGEPMPEEPLGVLKAQGGYTFYRSQS